MDTQPAGDKLLQLITTDYLNELKAKVKSSNIRGKQEALRHLTNLERYAKMGKLEVKPGSICFVIENRLMATAFDIETEEE